MAVAEVFELCAVEDEAPELTVLEPEETELAVEPAEPELVADLDVVAGAASTVVDGEPDSTEGFDVELTLLVDDVA